MNECQQSKKDMIVGQLLVVKSFSVAVTIIFWFSTVHRRNGSVVGSRYGPGNGAIWLDGVQCNGMEADIADCRHRGWGQIVVTRCGHSHDVSISCLEGSH